MFYRLVLTLTLMATVCCTFFRHDRKESVRLNPDNVFFNGISECDSATAYLLYPESSDTAPALVFRAFEVIGRPQKLNKFHKEEFSLIIREPSKPNDLIISCTFLPDIGFRFFKDKQETDVLIAFYCDEWLFAKDSVMNSGSCSHVHQELVRLSKRLFPEHLKNLK